VTNGIGEEKCGDCCLKEHPATPTLFPKAQFTADVVRPTLVLSEQRHPREWWSMARAGRRRL
jgi:hypothetical protein